MEVTRTFDLLNKYQEEYVNKNAFVAKENNKWVKYSTQQYVDNSYHISYGLLALGLRRGDKVVTISNNRPEWNFVDMGMAMIGVVHVPIFTSLTSDEYTYILNNSDAKLLIVSDEKLLKLLETSLKKVNNIHEIYTFDNIEYAKNWKEIIELGRINKNKYKEEVEKTKREIKPNDFTTLIYTSGTTGVSKGVMLSHENLVRNFIAAAEVFNMNSDQKYLSILPLCHVGGRMGNYQSQYSGCTIIYAENMGTIAANMKEHQPHGFDAVPRILEKVFDAVIAKGKKLKGIKKAIFFWAVKIGLKYKTEEESSILYKLKLRLANKLIFVKWRDALGGKVQLVGCGGAALQPRLERVFWAAGIKILNMYGLTETSPIITINRLNKPDLKLGSVGCIIDGVEIKIAEDGEILCKGHNVMLGYYNNQELTNDVIDKEGWFHTGDIGHLEHKKFLKVTDRKKEIFKLSSGKFVAPQQIENKFKESLFIEQICVIGEHEKYASALIAPNYAFICDWAKANGISYNNRKELISDQRINAVFTKEVRNFNKSFADFEKITRFRIVPDEWSPASGELSATLKLKRKFILEKYSKIVEKIYSKQSV